MAKNKVIIDSDTDPAVAAMKEDGKIWHDGQGHSCICSETDVKVICMTGGLRVKAEKFRSQTSDFGQMQQRWWEESETRKSQRKEQEGAQKG